MQFSDQGSKHDRVLDARSQYQQKKFMSENANRISEPLFAPGHEQHKVPRLHNPRMQPGKEPVLTKLPPPPAMKDNANVASSLYRRKRQPSTYIKTVDEDGNLLPSPRIAQKQLTPRRLSTLNNPPKVPAELEMGLPTSKYSQPLRPTVFKAEGKKRTFEPPAWGH